MQLSVTPFGKFTAYRFSDAEAQLSFTVIPERGALLSEFIYQSQNVIDGSPTPESVDFNDWGKSWLLFPFPNRLKDGQYKWQGNSYQFPINDGQNHNALHGFINEVPFDVVQTEISQNAAGNERAEIVLRHIYAGERDYYPFPFSMTIHYRIDTSGACTVAINIENTGDTALPMGFGWHPYFQLTEQVKDLKLNTEPLQMIGIDQRMIPTGKRYEYDQFINKKSIGAEVLDNCFTFAKSEAHQAITSIENENLRLEFWQDTAVFPYVQLFTPPNRQTLAIEPMTCNVDAFNNEDRLVKLATKEKWEGKFGFNLSVKSRISRTP